MEHSGMQDFWVSLAGARGSILLSSIDKKSIFTLSCRAVPAVCGSIRSCRGPGRGWQSHVSAGSRGGSGSAAPTRCAGAGACGEGEREGVLEQQHPFPAGSRRAEAQGMLLWEGGKKERLGLFLEGLKGAELALVTQRAMRKAPVMLKSLTALLQTKAQTFLLCVNQPRCAQRALCTRDEGLCIPKTSPLLVPEALAAPETIKKVPNSIHLGFAGLSFMQSIYSEGC